jgi:hypothetical protein
MTDSETKRMLHVSGVLTDYEAAILSGHDAAMKRILGRHSRRRFVLGLVLGMAVGVVLGALLANLIRG